MTECWSPRPGRKSSMLEVKTSSFHIPSTGDKHHGDSSELNLQTLFSCAGLVMIRLSVVFCCHQESSCCSALPSPPPVSTICCGPSPTFCSRLPFGAVKYKSAPKLPQTRAPPGRAEPSCAGGLALSAPEHGRPALQLHVAVYLSSSNIKSVERTKAYSDTVPVFGLVQTLRTE